KHLQSIVAIIDEIDAASTGHNGNAEQRSSAGCRFHGRCGDLRASGCRLHEVSIITIRSDDMAVGRDRQPEWIIERAVRTHIEPCKGRGWTRERTRYRGDPIVDAVGHVEGAVLRESDTRGANDQGRRIRRLRKPRADHRRCTARRYSFALFRNLQCDAQHGALIDLMWTTSGYVAIEHIGHEEPRMLLLV